MSETQPEEDLPNTEPEVPPVSEPDVTGDDPETVIEPSSDAVSDGETPEGESAL